MEDAAAHSELTAPVGRSMPLEDKNDGSDVFDPARELPESLAGQVLPVADELVCRSQLGGEL